jgi:hypothetical protein
MKHLIFIFCCFLIAACKPMKIPIECEDKTILERLSSDKKALATLKIRDCGATTEITQIIQIKQKSEFESDIYIVRGDAEINFEWIDNQLLITSDATRENIFKKINKQQGIIILYK